MKKLFKTFALLFIVTQLLAQERGHKYKREIGSVKHQWHKITLPIDLFGKTADDFRDIRITSKIDSIEAPYLINRVKGGDITEEVTLDLINKSYNNRGYFYTFKSGSKKELNRIQLDFNRRNFDWRLKLEGSQNQREWFTIKDNYRAVAVKNAYTDYRFTKIIFPNSIFRYYRVTVKSKIDPKLTNATLLKRSSNEVKRNAYSIASIHDTTDRRKKATTIILSLDHKVPVSEVKLNFKENIDYYRSVRLEYLVDSTKTQKGYHKNYRTLSTGIVTSFEPNEFKFEERKTDKIRVVIANNDNEPLHFLSAEVIGDVYEIVARFDPEKQYVLLYGDENLRRPNYEIAYLQKSIPTELVELNLEKEETIFRKSLEEETGLLESPIWLWAVMGLIIVLLAWFSLGMVRGNK